MPRQNPTNASASAKLVISQRRRRPLGLDGRQTRARYCIREIGKGNVEILGNSEKVKVGITELQERLDVLVQIGSSIQQVAQQARSENGQEVFEIFWQEEKVYVASWARWDAQWRGLVELERRCQDISREIQMHSKRQEMFQNAIEGKLRVQSRASERLQDQIIEEIKEMEHTKTEEALQLAGKEHDLWMYQNEKEEAERLQGARKPRKDGDMVWAPPRNYQNGQTGKRRKRWNKASGGWSLKGKRKCQKSLSCRMRWKALSWTWRENADVSR